MFHAGRRDGQELQLKTVVAGAFLQQRNRLFAKRAVVVHKRYFFALEFVPATFFFGNGLHDGVGGHPVGARDREVPLEDRAIGAFAAAIAHRQHGNFVARGFFGDGKSSACGQCLDKAGVLAFQAFIAFHAAGGVIAGLAFFIGDLDVVDTAFAVDQLQIVDKTIGPRCAIGRIRAGAVGQHRNELFFGLRQHRRGRGQHHSAEQRGQQQDWFFHLRLLHENGNTSGFNTGTARHAFFACRSTTTWPNHEVPRSGTKRSSHQKSSVRCATPPWLKSPCPPCQR